MRRIKGASSSKSLLDRLQKLAGERSRIECESLVQLAELDKQIEGIKEELNRRLSSTPTDSRISSESFLGGDGPKTHESSDSIEAGGSNGSVPVTQKAKILVVLEASAKPLKAEQVAEALDVRYGGYGDEGAGKRVFYALQTLRAADKSLVVKPKGTKGLWMHGARARDAGLDVE